MNEQEFEKLLEMAKSKDDDTRETAAIIAESSDLPYLDKQKIWGLAFWLPHLDSIKKSLYPFKKR